jgi:uncharacterized protein (DUF1778 family)
MGGPPSSALPPSRTIGLLAANLVSNDAEDIRLPGVEQSPPDRKQKRILSGQKPYTFSLMEPISAKTRRIEIRMTDEERDLEQAAAAARGQTLSEFVRQAARREAEEVLAERTSIALNPEEATRFLAALDDSSSFEAGLGALTERPSVLGG